MSSKSNGKPRRSRDGEPSVSLPPFGDLHEAVTKLRRQSTTSAAINDVIQCCRANHIPTKQIPKHIEAMLGVTITDDNVRRRISRMAKRRPTLTECLSGVDEDLAELLKLADELYLQIADAVCPGLAPQLDFTRSWIGSFMHRDWRIPSADPDTLPDESQRRKVAKLLRDPHVARLFDECDALLIRIGYLLFTRQWWSRLHTRAFRPTHTD
jgi:hypothetical protein